MTIGVELDDEGKIVRVVVYVNDEETADKVIDCIKDISDETDCEGEYGYVCRISEYRTTRTKTDPLVISTSYGKRTEGSMTCLLFFLTLFIHK